MKKTVIAVLFGLLLVSLLFVGCNKQATGGSAQQSAAAGMEMVVGNGAEPMSIDPSQVNGVPEHRLYLAFFEGLVRYDPKTANVIPGVAESWTFSNNNTVITFKLRQGVQWSDGTAITAQQIVESWLHHLDPNTASPYAYMMGQVVKGADDYNTKGGRRQDVAIRAVDASTFEVTLTGPVSYVPDVMAHYAFSPLPMHAIQKNGSAWTRPGNIVCNGPFILSEWVPNSHITGIPNDKYWDKANVHLTKITFLPVDDTNTAYQQFNNGETDWSTSVPLALIDQVKLRKEYQVSPQLGTYYYYINLRDHAALRDARVRKALSMAFNRDELINNVVKGGQIPAYSFSPPMGDYKPSMGPGFNVTEAKRLLAEAGFPDGRGFPTFSILYNTNDSHRIIAEYIQQAWRNNLGINVTLRNSEWATYLEERHTPTMEICRAGWIADYMDPGNFLEIIITESENNAGHYSNPEYDRLVRQAAAMQNGPERYRILNQAEEIAIVRDQAIMPIYYYVSQNMIDLDKWDGWYQNALDTHPYVGIKRK